MPRGPMCQSVTRHLWPPGLLAAALLLSAAAPAQPQSDRSGRPVTLSFGIVPQQSPARLAKLWTPVLAYLNRHTGYALEFETAKDIPTFQHRLAAGEYAIAYMNPYHYVVFHKSPGYRVFAHPSGKLRGIIVVRKDSPYQTLGELRGKTIAFPAPAAFAATVLPEAYFRKKGIPITSRYVASHDSVYMAVADGLYPAGGGITRTFYTLRPAIRDKLRILWTTPGFTPHAFAALPKVPRPVVERIQRAMIAMSRNPQGAALLKRLGFKRIVAAHDSEYNDIRALHLDLLKIPARE